MVEEKKKEKTTQQPLKGEVMKTEEKEPVKEPTKEVSKEDIQKLAEMQGADQADLASYPYEQAGQNLPAKAEDVRFRVARMEGIDPLYVIMMGRPGQEKPFVTKEGLYKKADMKGYRAIQTEEKEVKYDAEGNPISILVEGRLWPNISKDEVELIKASVGLCPEVQKELLSQLLKPFISIALTSVRNMKMKELHVYMHETAATRAQTRVLRMFTACGLTSVEEMPEYTGDEAGDK